MKKALTLLAVVMLMFSALSIAPAGSDVAVAQNRRVYLEEFTGAWCGFCVRGAWAIEKLDEKYPGQVIAISIHNANGDPMITKQGDSLNQGIGFPQRDNAGWPDGWTARQMIGSKWDLDPSNWINPLEGFGATAGIVDTMVGQPAEATVDLTDVTYDPGSGMVSAKVTAKFMHAMSGDLRINLMVTEDSVIGEGGSAYDQTNYYYQNPNYGDESNPFWDMNTTGQPGHGTIEGWAHMHVFREAVAGIKGLAGLIPSSVSTGETFSKTFTFKLPSNVDDPNHVHLIAIVHQYSATSSTKNQVFDAAKVKLLGTSLKTNPAMVITLNDQLYTWAHANGTAPVTFTVTNIGDVDADVTPTVDVASNLPAGWSVSFAPNPVHVGANKSENVTATVTAPENSAFVAPTIVFSATETGAFVPSTSSTFYMLSDNTKTAMFYPSTLTPDYAAATLSGPIVNHAAFVPLSGETVDAYDPRGFDFLMFLNDPQIENDGTQAWTPVLRFITDALENGKKVFITSNDAGSWAFAGTSATKTPEIQAFFKDTLGLTYKSNKSRISNNAYVQFNINPTADPLVAGLGTLSANATGAIAGSPETAIFGTTANTKSVPLFYSDGTKTNNIGFSYQNGAGAKLIYLGFSLNCLANQKLADTIFNRSVNWLQTASTPPPPPAAVEVANALTQFVASPSIFHTSTQINYSLAVGEHDVTFSAYDLLGREVAKLAPKTNGSTVSATFDASALSAGTYVIVKHSSTGSQEIRVVNE